MNYRFYILLFISVLYFCQTPAANDSVLYNHAVDYILKDLDLNENDIVIQKDLYDLNSVCFLNEANDSIRPILYDDLYKKKERSETYDFKRGYDGETIFHKTALFFSVIQDNIFTVDAFFITQQLKNKIDTYSYLGISETSLSLFYYLFAFNQQNRSIEVYRVRGNNNPQGILPKDLYKNKTGAAAIQPSLYKAFSTGHVPLAIIPNTLLKILKLRGENLF